MVVEEEKWEDPADFGMMDFSQLQAETNKKVDDSTLITKKGGPKKKRRGGQKGVEFNPNELPKS